MPLRDRSYQCFVCLVCVGFSLALGACEESLKLPARMLGNMPIDAGMPAHLAQSGDKCNSDDQCESAHCNHDVCCDSGDCCLKPADCKTVNGVGAVCEMTTCQGTRGMVTCDDFRCKVKDGIEDDSVCTDDMISDTCGLYASTFCNGKVKQSTPKCLTECSDDKDCDEDAHCDQQQCIPDLPEGAACVANTDCMSNHCDGKVCCASGVCCTTANDCQMEQFRSPPTCDNPAACEGTRGEPACEAHTCTMKKIPDDSGCDRTVIANACNGGAPVKCSGERDQRTPPACGGATCLQDYECARTAFCMRGICTPDYANGDTCTAPEMCQSGHCENGSCCSYDCCDTKNRCSGAPCDAKTQCNR